MSSELRAQMFCEKTADGVFERELSELINRHGIDSCVNIEDFVLAEYLMQTIDAVENVQREIKRLRSPQGASADE